MVDIEQIAANLEPVGEGLWKSRDTPRVSYSETGNERCLEVEDCSFWFGYRNLLILEAITLFPPNGAIFDVGGGNGYVSLAIKNAGFEPVVVEPGQGAMNAYQRGLRPVLISTLQAAKFSPETLPAVGIFDVLEHIDDDDGFLRTLKSLVAQGGRLYITVPAYRCLWSPEDVRAGHYRRYRLKELRAKLETAGFRIEFETYMFGLLVAPIFFLRTVPGWLGLRQRRDVPRTHREHGAGYGWASKLMARQLKTEARRIASGRSLPCGSSCLVVARS